MKTSVASILTLLLLLVCRPVAAEKAVVLTPDTSGVIQSDLVELTQWLIADWLKERGVERLMPQDAAADLSPGLKQCRNADCASRYIESVGNTDYAIVTTLTQSGQGNGIRIEIILVSRDGTKYSQDWPVGEAIESAVDAALTHVYTAFLSDQSERNADQKMPIGEREADLDTVVQPEPVKNDADTAIDSHSDQADRSSVWNYIIGASFIAGSVPLFVAPIYVAANQGKVVDTDEWERHKTYDFGGVSVVELSLAGALLLTGAFFTLFEPITVEGELSVGDGRGVVRLKGSF